MLDDAGGIGQREAGGRARYALYHVLLGCRRIARVNNRAYRVGRECEVITVLRGEGSSWVHQSSRGRLRAHRVTLLRRWLPAGRVHVCIAFALCNYLANVKSKKYTDLPHHTQPVSLPSFVASLFAGNDEPQALLCRRWQCFQPLEQGIYPLYQEWQSPEDCERTLPSPRYTLLFKTVHCLPVRSAYRLPQQG